MPPRKTRQSLKASAQQEEDEQAAQVQRASSSQKSPPGDSSGSAKDQSHPVTAQADELPVRPTKRARVSRAAAPDTLPAAPPATAPSQMTPEPEPPGEREPDEAPPPDAPPPPPPSPPPENAPPAPPSDQAHSQAQDTSLAAQPFTSFEADGDTSYILPPSRPQTNGGASGSRKTGSAKEAGPDGGRTEEAEGEVLDAEYWSGLLASEKEKSSVQELYLDTIDRSRLDFDFERQCSVTLSRHHIYCCLVCGKYFQGRGVSSPAYAHSIGLNHRVFLNLDVASSHGASAARDAAPQEAAAGRKPVGEIWILPEGERVQNKASLNALRDVVYNLDPTYTVRDVMALDGQGSKLDLHKSEYIPGFIGLNNTRGASDYLNVVVQILAHITPIRNYFLLHTFVEDSITLPSSGAQDALARTGKGKVAGNGKPSELLRLFSLLLRRMWNGKAFKAQLSPHEFAQEVIRRSRGAFGVEKQADPLLFLSWLLNTLHADLAGGNRGAPTIISQTLQGQIRIESQKVFVRSGIEIEDEEREGAFVSGGDADGRREGGQEDALGGKKFNIEKEIQTQRTPFFHLSVDLPSPPVFQDVVEKNIIPQVSLASVLSKYDGVTFEEAKGLIRRFKITKLPPFVVLHFKRFLKNGFREERNLTVVNFQIKDLDWAPYVEDPSNASLSTAYDLVANVTHEATAGTVRDNSVFRAQVHTRVSPSRSTSSATAAEPRATIDPTKQPAEEEEEEQEREREEKWFQIQDLIVEEVNKQMLFLGETYIQVWERKGAAVDVERALQELEKRGEPRQRQARGASGSGRVFKGQNGKEIKRQ